MDIVDSQVHVGPGGIAERIAAMDAIGIKSIVIDEAWLGQLAAMMPSHKLANGVTRPVAPTAELASLTHPDRFSYILRVDRQDPELRSVIRLMRDAPHCRGLRILPGMSMGELDAFAAGAYDNVFAEAADAGLPLLTFVPGYASHLSRYLKKFPSLKVIIDHCGVAFPGPGVAPDVLAKTQSAAFDEVLRLADQKNVALKWAHAQRFFGVTGYPYAGLRPILRRALNSFGADRVMWASDIGVNQTGESWGELVFWHRDNPDLSASERVAIMGRTARTWFNWKA